MTETTKTAKTKIGLTYCSATTDDRRNKDYFRELTLTVEIPKRMTEEGLPYSTDEFPIARYVDVLANMRPKAVVDPAWGRRGDTQVFYLKFKFTTEKPSLIPSEEACITAMDDKADAQTEFGTLAESVEFLLNAAHQEHEKIRELVKIRNQTSRLCGWVAQEADEEARKIVRLEQRLAAIYAELEAEQSVQLAEMLKKGARLDEGVAEHNGEHTDQFDPCAVELARKLAKRFVPSAKPGLFRGAREAEIIKLEEIE